MNNAGNKIRNLVLIIGILVALFAGILSVFLNNRNEPVTQPAAQESKIANETKSSVLTGILSLAFKSGLDLVQVVRNSK